MATATTTLLDSEVSVPATRWIGTVSDLLERLQIDLDGAIGAGVDVDRLDFPLRVPLAFVDRMRPGRLDDPLLRQVLPWNVERETAMGWSKDPLAELTSGRTRGALVSKYEGRALLLLTGACAVHCRYCFRRHFPYAEHARRTEVLSAVRDLRGVQELILSGGDPLTWNNERLEELVEELLQHQELETLRIHTRSPVVEPHRVDAGLRSVLDSWRQAGRQLVVVLHSNHGHEIDSSVGAAAAALRSIGATLLNQSVLLRGVNDDVPSLVGLSRALFGVGVLPYYLHLLDRVQGAAHFEVPESEALELWNSLHGRLPGYLVPRLVREIPGRAGKTVLVPRQQAERELEVAE